MGREGRLHLGPCSTLLYLSPGGVRSRQSLLPSGPGHSGPKSSGEAQMGLLGVQREGATERAAGSDTSPLTGLTPGTEELTIHRCLGCRPSQRHLPHPSHASPAAAAPAHHTTSFLLPAHPSYTASLPPRSFPRPHSLSARPFLPSFIPSPRRRRRNIHHTASFPFRPPAITPSQSVYISLHSYTFTALESFLLPLRAGQSKIFTTQGLFLFIP